MFARGPRFEPTKDVPAPNAYNIQQESALENYKKGAFLDKGDRFKKDKLEGAPENRKESPNHTASERYLELQNRVDVLEKVHWEGKRAHHVELEKLKQELAASQKQAVESADKLEKQKKQKAALEAAMQELKKTSLSDQGEIRDLRHRLRLLELDRDKVAAKQPDLNEARTSLRSLEAKRREEVSDRDRRIVELERKLEAENKKRELLESKNRDTTHLFEEESRNIRSVLQEKENLLKAVQDELRLTKEKFCLLETNNSHRAEELMQQLERHRSLMTTVAQEYSALASQSVSLAEYNRLKEENLILQGGQFRLERKLANSEAQVQELAHLIRQVKEQNADLSQQLCDTLAEIDHLSQSVADRTQDTHHEDNLYPDLLDFQKHLAEEHQQLFILIRDTEVLLSTYYHLRVNELYAVSTDFAQEHINSLALFEQRGADLAAALASHEAIASCLESIQKERIVDQEVLHTAKADIDKLRSSVAVLEVQLSDALQQLEESDSIHTAALKKEQAVVQLLTTSIQKSRSAEEALRSDIDRLTDELANTEVYQEAYERLYDQVGSLITRNQIAEEEAERISKLNAQILGHHNPAQRILYVDRIRAELAEAKMTNAELIRDQETLKLQNGELEHELHLYKSVRVDDKPRTNITRITRPPLVNLTHSLDNGLHVKNLTSAEVIP